MKSELRVVSLKRPCNVRGQVISKIPDEHFSSLPVMYSLGKMFAKNEVTKPKKYSMKLQKRKKTSCFLIYPEENKFENTLSGTEDQLFVRTSSHLQSINQTCYLQENR